MKPFTIHFTHGTPSCFITWIVFIVLLGKFTDKRNGDVVVDHYHLDMLSNIMFAL